MIFLFLVFRYLYDLGKVKGNWTDQTPLHIAVREGKVNFVRFLAESGEYLNTSDAHGNTPLHLAVNVYSVLACVLPFVTSCKRG